MADKDGSKRISFSEAEGILSALGFKKDADMRREMRTSVDVDGSGDIDMNEFKKMIQGRVLETSQTGRDMVVVTLAEAESIRFLLHAKHPSLTGQCAVSIEALEGGVIDRTPSFPFMETTEYLRNKQCLRFLDGSMHMTTREAFALLQGVQENKEKSREDFFKNILKYRRRDRKEYNDCPIKLVFTTKDEYQLLAYRLKVARFRHALQQKGFMLLDAFRRFDTNGNGSLCAGEVMAAIRSLHLDLHAADAAEIINMADANNDGQLDYLEFAQCFADKEDDTKDSKDSKRRPTTAGGTWVCGTCTMKNPRSAAHKCLICGHKKQG
mmetsp:Transcript_11008/g.21661  ORF Transcript_11008/g.21661 Transcript_11008/m.21661 type:complete len:324 (-) Transcript_11008:109-1080(-)